MTDEKKPDCTLSDGTAIYFDKRKITRKEWMRLFDSDQPPAEADEIVGRFAGMPAETVANMNLYDWQLLNAAMFEAVRRPVSPNSPAMSISPSSTESPLPTS
jgi:hypothetical protein